MADRPSESAPAPKPDSTKANPPVVRRWTSQDILGEATEAHIQHGAETYRLLLTRNQKLILIK